MSIPKDVITLLKNKENEAIIVKALYIHGKVSLQKRKMFTYANISKKVIDITVEAETYRSLFPPNKKSSSKEVVQKLQKFLEENDSYDMDDIMRATKSYLSQLTDVTYCEKAGNFISKRIEGNVERSTLLEYLERGFDSDITQSLGKTI